MKKLTEGSVYKLMLAFAVPVFFGSVFQQLYNIIDTVLIGRLLGVNELAGVGSTTGITFFIISISTGLCNGFAVSISQKFGKGDKKALKRYLGNAIILAAIITTILTTISAVLCKPLLKLIRTPDEILSYAYGYVIIMIFGMAATMLYNFFSAMLRAIGDSRTPVIYLVISSFVNIVLDVVFMKYLTLGVSGAALATVIAQLFSGILCIIHIKRKIPVLHIERNDLVLSVSISKEQLSTALPMGIQGFVISIGIMVVQMSINSMGTMVVAGVTAGNKLYGIMVAPIEAVCQFMIPFSAQNYGVDNKDRIYGGVKKVLITTSIMTAVLFVTAWFAGKAMIGIFISGENEKVISYGHRFMLYYVAGFITLAIQECLCATLQGMKLAKWTILSGVMELLGRLAAALLLTRYLGYTAVCLALPLAWLFTSLYLIPIYKHFKSKNKITALEAYQ